ncbi:hypothetical protein CXB51_008567 [Gossypium anomalum]|uniref:Uncharacterized protein n=1 Tax=Gossypium anomalum TaxID=47600 RepID=A0A8J6D6B0_9ROSI|nr:hypothetical protein CXB51_008567 [Gossypium anomalum]
MEEMNNKLQEKIVDLQDLESTKKAFIYKERFAKIVGEWESLIQRPLLYAHHGRRISRIQIGIQFSGETNKSKAGMGMLVVEVSYSEHHVVYSEEISKILILEESMYCSH